jgi:hypothetical protein
MCKEAHTANAAQYVEVVRARAPRGFSEAIRAAAETRRMTQSEFIRSALAEKLQSNCDGDRQPVNMARAG